MSDSNLKLTTETELEARERRALALEAQAQKLADTAWERRDRPAIALGLTHKAERLLDHARRVRQGGKS